MSRGLITHLYLIEPSDTVAVIRGCWLKFPITVSVASLVLLNQDLSFFEDKVGPDQLASDKAI